MSEIAQARLGEALGTDFFSVREQFTHEQWDRFAAVRAFTDTEVIPVVPAAHRLPGARSFKDAGRVLASTRSTCAWAALGHSTAAYDAALRYRHQCFCLIWVHPDPLLPTAP